MRTLLTVVVLLCVGCTQGEFVRCTTTAGNFTLAVQKKWAPIGAARFIELVKVGFFDNQLLYRAVKNFVFQFGISSDPAVQAEWKDKIIEDDRHGVTEFRRGVMSFAGHGKKSRSTHVFFCDGKKSLGKDPKNAHEVPFAYIYNGYEMEAFMDNVHTGYGDLSKAQTMFMSEGDSIFEEHFPDLTRIHECKMMPAKEALALDEKTTKEFKQAAIDKKAREEREEAERIQAEEDAIAHDAMVLKRISLIIDKKSPGMKKKLPKMLEAWSGRETALLEKLEKKHDLSRDDEL